MCLEKAIDIYTDMGRFTMAAKQHQNIAEMYETEVVDLERAINNYEKAADYFMAEESKSSANKCKLKVAQYAAQLEDYDRAIQIYEEVLYKCVMYQMSINNFNNFIIGCWDLIGQFFVEIQCKRILLPSGFMSFVC